MHPTNPDQPRKKVHVLHYNGVPLHVCLGTRKEAMQASYRYAVAEDKIVVVTTVEVIK